MTEVTRESLAAALREIRDICDTDRDDLREKYGSEFRAYMAVIPSIVDRALAALPSPASEPPPGRDNIGELRRQVLQLGGRLYGFDHTLLEESSKPSDPSDIRWDCLCGYGNSPEKVRQHWEANLAEYESERAAQPAPDLDETRLGEALCNVYHPGGWWAESEAAEIHRETARKVAAEYARLLQARESGGEP